MRGARFLPAVALALVAASAAATLADPRPPSPARLPLTQKEAEEMVKEMSPIVERIRGLKFKTPVTMQVIDGKSARRQFRSKVEPRDEEQMRYTQEAYYAMGLVPRGTDLLTHFLDRAEQDVEGYYEPGSKTFYLLDHVVPDDIRPVVAHELTHALEDQHYDLRAIARLAGGDDDRATAISALIEGSATVVMLAYYDQEMRRGKAAIKDAEGTRSKRIERLKTAPSFAQRSLMLPYVLGFRFLLRGHPGNVLRGGVPKTDLDYAYAHPPLSTRHIIHPHLYWRRSDLKFTAPQLRDLSPILGAGWTKATEGSIGELGLAVLTGAPIDFGSRKIFSPGSWSNRAAAGTIGDVFQYYLNGDRRLTVLVTGWENAAQAAEFSRALKPSQARRDFLYGANHLMLIGDVESAEKADELATAAFAGATYWPRDESIGQWPPDEAPD